MITCKACGAENQPGARFCTKCRNPVQHATPTVPVSPAAQTIPVTQPLSATAVTDGATTRLALPDFSTLPSGALLKERRYEVFSVLAESPQRNIYLAYDHHRQECPSCHFLADSNENKFCEICGTALAEKPESHPLLRLWETPDAPALATKNKLAQLNLRHPSLITVYDAFSQPVGSSAERHYAVVDQEVGQSLAALADPPSIQDVLAWARQLAEGLAYLHERKYHFPTLSLDRMRLVGKRAKLSNLEQIESLPKGGESAAMARNINALLPLLLGILANQPLPATVTTLLERAKANHYTNGKVLAAEIDAVLVELRRSANLYWQTGRLSDLGKVREINEDSLLTLELARVHDSNSRPLALFAVADGMGGHEGGEIASALAISVLAQYIVEKVIQPASGQSALPQLDYGNLLKEGCQSAARAVHAEASRRRTDMGTTLIAALLAGSDLYVANVGDSRAYRVNQEKIEQIGLDHTYVELLIAKQQLTREQAQNHPQGNLIYRSLGEKANVEVDLHHQQLAPGEWLLLCSDGLNGYVGDDQIHRTITASAYPQLACYKLIDLANAAGGHDNITAIVVKVE